MKGRRPKPVEQKLREGNPGGRKLPAALVLRQGVVEPPDDLPADARKLWDELVPILSEANVLNRVDSAMLMALCMQWDRAAQARRVIAAQGIFAFGSMGQLVEHPALQIERAAYALLLRFAEQFGITPVARARIAAAVAVMGATMRDELTDSLADLDDDLVDGGAA